MRTTGRGAPRSQRKTGSDSGEMPTVPPSRDKSALPRSSSAIPAIRIFCAEAASVHIGVADDVSVEHGEEADGMEGIINHHAVQKHLVLYGRAATDVELSALVAGGVDSGEHLEVLCKVGGATDRGHLAYLCGTDFFYRDLGLYFSLLNTLVGDIDGPTGFAFGFEGYVADDGLPFFDGDGFGVFLIAYKAHPQGVVAFWHFVDEIESVDVGGGTVACAFKHDVGKGDSFACLDVGEGALDGLGMQ